MTVRFIAPRVPLVDLTTGQITREWYLALQSLFDTSGQGAVSDTDSALVAPAFNGDALSTEISALAGEIDALATDFGQQPAPQIQQAAADDVSPLNSGALDQIAAVRAAVNDLMKGPVA